MMTSSTSFWKTTALEDMTEEQWEALCDGCGRCCLNKLRDDETDEILWTNVSCRLLDGQSCACSDYARRHRRIPDCISLTPTLLKMIDWLPPTCAYRLVADGFDLPDWHPLVSGSRETVHESGVSVRDRCVNERHAGMLEDYLVEWPGEWPGQASPCIAPYRRKM